MGNKTGFYASFNCNKHIFQFGASVGYDNRLKDLCIWIQLGFWGIYVGYQSKKFKEDDVL
jgi:hypothetical protein